MKYGQEHASPRDLALYVMAICAITVATHVFLTPETRGRSLD